MVIVMNKEKIFSWIESLEDKANESDKYFIERNNLYVENQKLKEEINKLKEQIVKYQDEIFAINNNWYDMCD